MIKKSIVNQVLIIGLLLFSAPTHASASFGSIGGKVFDRQTMQPLAGANVIISGTIRGASTDTEGHFIINKIDPGSYTIEFHYLGYTSLKKGNVIVNPKRTTILEVGLEEKITAGETIEVSASFFEKPREALVSSRSMNFEEIRRSPGDLVDIQRAVHALPSVATGSDQLNEIIIRGGYPGENLFIMDNIEIPNPNHFAVQGAGGGQINLLNSYMVRSLDFYAGAFSAKYGDKASSVLEIFLREGARDRFRAEGSFGMAGVGILAEGPLGSKGSYMFSARKSYLDWIITSIDLTAVPEYYSLQSKVVYDLSRRHALLFNAVYGGDEINFEDEEASGFGRGGENVDTQNSQWIGGITLRSLWSEQLFSNTTISAVQNNYDVDVYEKPAPDVRDTFYESQANETEYTLKTDFVYRMKKNVEVNFGASYKNVNFRYDNRLDADTLFYYFNNIKSDSAFRYYPEDRVNENVTSFKMALYAQISWDLFGKLRLNGGLRYNYFTYTAFTSWSPRLGISWLLTPRTTMSLAYGKHYQSPSYFNLVENDVNRNLKSKYTDQYVLSFDHLFREDIKLILETYYKTYHDVPENKTLTTVDPFDFDDGEMLNGGSGRSYGFEVFLQKKLTKRFSTILSYARSKAEARDPRSGQYYDWDYDYQNIFTFISGYKYSFLKKKWYNDFKNNWWFYSVAWLPFLPADEFEISMKLRYLGGRPYTAPTPYDNLQEWVVEEKQQLNGSRYPAYHRLDIRIDRRIIFDNWTFVIFFDLNNIYNRDNLWAYQYGYDEEGNREIKEVLQYKTLPIGGFTIEF